MQTISLATISRFSAYLVYILNIVGLLFICSVNALAKNSCYTNATLINPAIHADSGIGGTGIVAFDSDIGGTGINDGGIGGTKNQVGSVGEVGSIVNDSGIGGTGIVGTITGFASVCVNNVEIHYDTNTLITVDGRLSAMRDLAVGQVIAVQANDSDGAFNARTIAVTHAVVGPISSVNSEERQLRVLGQIIQVDKLANPDSFSDWKAGHWVQVSGYRRASGMITATRIESIPPVVEVVINGYVNHVDANGFEVNGTRIDYDVKTLPVEFMQNMEVRVLGHWDGAYLKAQFIEIEPTRQILGKVEHAVIEGYIHALNDNEVNLSNQIITLHDNVQLTASNSSGDFKIDQFIQVSGRLDENHRVIAEQIELKHESLAQLRERSDSWQVDDSDKSTRENSENELESKPAKVNKSSENHYDPSDGNKDHLKKETDQNPSMNQPSDVSTGTLILIAVIMIPALVFVVGMMMIFRASLTSQSGIKRVR